VTDGKTGAAKAMTTPSKDTMLEYDPSLEINSAVDFVRTAVRRHGGLDSPLGPKASRTRSRLLKVGLELLTSNGYLNTNPAQIADAAGVSEATFYQYFSDMKGLVVTLAGENTVSMLERHVDVWDPETGRIGLRRALAAFVTAYMDNVDFFRIWDQVVQVDSRLADVKKAFMAGHRHRIEKTLRKGIEMGLVRSDLDPAEMARALTLMTVSYCSDVALSDPPKRRLGRDEIIDFLTSFWAESIGQIESSTIRRELQRANSTLHDVAAPQQSSQSLRRGKKQGRAV
jgi:AcrR family transcriptional regulator